MRPLSFLLILAMAACHAPSSKDIDYKHSYTLTGKITGYPEGDVFLQHPEKNNQLDKAVIEEGIFTFTGVADAPEYCRLGFLSNGAPTLLIGFFLQNGHINLVANTDSLQGDAVRITGSPAEDEYRNFRRHILSIDSPDIRKKYIITYARQHPSSYVAAYQVNSIYSSSSDVKELDSLYNGMDKSVQTAWYGQQIKYTLDKLRLTDIGIPAPGFSLPGTDGKNITLSSFKGKYVLVDFWASWCGPCRKENPNYIKAWRRFHQKGFDILGVSLDNDKQRWLEAIKKDQLPWTQISDLNGWHNQAAQLYGVRGIPMNYLLDRDGRIVAKDLRGENLEKHLAMLLH